MVGERIPAKPTVPPAPLEQALARAFALYQQRKLAEAEQLYRQILESAPEQADALHVLGVIRLEQGSRDQAVELIAAAVRIAPDAAPAHFHLGLALAGRGDHGEAVASFERALAIAPGLAAAHYQRGNALRRLGRLDEAVASYQQALTLAPDHVDALNNCGLLLVHLNRQAEALACFDKALARKPENAFALNNRGLALGRLGRHADAIGSYDKALAVAGRYANARYNRGNSLRKLHRYAEAIADYEKVLAIESAHAHAPGALAEAALHICDWRRLAQLHDGLQSGAAAGGLVIAPLALLALDFDPAQQLAGIRRYAREELGAPAPAAWSDPARRHDKIRVAYLSSDFRQHAVSTLTAELFERHDRTRFEVIGISLGPNDHSAMRARLIKAFDRFHDVRLMGDAAAARLVQDLDVDIAVDLNGHTDLARPGILARRPAPIQASWLGYPGTMGLECIDYLIADRIVAPFAEQAFFTEQIVQLPDCHLTHDSTRAIAQRPPSRAEAGLPDEGFVFCCFNQSYKIGAAVFEVWMRLLQAMPGSVLWLAAANETAAGNLRRAAGERGIDPARLVFAPRVERSEDHLARHCHAGLFLDTLPYNAHTTAIDALWAGVPVVTCMGRTVAGRTAASLLAAAGLPELVTHSLADYESLALRLAGDAAQLDAVRRKLAHNRTNCPLFDSDRFRRHLEAAFVTMWQRWQCGEGAGSFRVKVG